MLFLLPVSINKSTCLASLPQGIWTGPLVQTEFVAALGAMAVWWLAYTTRGKLLA